MIDVQVYLSRWPFRRLPGDEPSALAAALRRRGVTQAWTGAFDGIFHKDIAGANARLAATCRQYGPGLLVPFGSVNPKLPDWREDLGRCAEEFRMPGIRLHPNYHGYALGDPSFAELLRLAAARRLIVQLVLSMEDERTQTPLMRVPDVDLSPLPELLKKQQDARIAVLNADHLHAVEVARKLSASGGAWFDFCMVEGVGGVARLVRELSADRVLFSSNYPLYYFESAMLKVREAGFTDAERSAILEGNARKLLAA